MIEGLNPPRCTKFETLVYVGVHRLFLVIHIIKKLFAHLIQLSLQNNFETKSFHHYDFITILEILALGMTSIPFKYPTIFETENLGDYSATMNLFLH